ncbi:hypothetical protein N7510_008391 [Penicillium lagena]|uniref:uncharacterized protein n=1 Tax=Penicillium lagena TaxID=94218 RepID=UPI0025424FCB|nr:uncharacterized protein N7510_008391 [Penicillium lagena]KAJ5605610.1 hypothetical protein N7510_008391 [Penicillium lagena]
MYVRNTPPVIRAIENKHECPSNPESGHSQAVNHIFEPTADGKAYEDSRCQVEFVIPASCNPTVKTWILRRKWVISAETGFRLLRQQWKANCRGPLVIVVKPSHLAGKEDPNWIALASLFQVQDNGPNGVEPAAMHNDAAWIHSDPPTPVSVA